MLILDGLREYELQFPRSCLPIKATQEKGRQFLLHHQLYKSLTTGEALDPKMTLFSFPPRWHSDLLVVLDYFQSCRAGKDERIEPAIRLLESKRNSDGTWNLQNRHPGKTFFEMEQVGHPSRWNTLRAMRVLRWWYGG
jgi:hypothetical protein